MSADFSTAIPAGSATTPMANNVNSSSAPSLSTTGPPTIDHISTNKASANAHITKLVAALPAFGASAAVGGGGGGGGGGAAPSPRFVVKGTGAAAAKGKYVIGGGCRSPQPPPMNPSAATFAALATSPRGLSKTQQQQQQSVGSASAPSPRKIAFSVPPPPLSPPAGSADVGSGSGSGVLVVLPLNHGDLVPSAFTEDFSTKAEEGATDCATEQPNPINATAAATPMATAPSSVSLEQRLKKVAAERAVLQGDLVAAWPSRRVDPMESARIRGAMVKQQGQGQNAASASSPLVLGVDGKVASRLSPLAHSAALAMAGPSVNTLAAHISSPSIGGGPSSSAASGGAVSPRSALKAPLAIEIDGFIRGELRRMGREDTAMGTPPTRLQTLAVYREAFGVLLSRFPEYSDVLSRIKTAYDETVDGLVTSQQGMLQLQTENRALREANKDAVHALKERQRRETATLRADYAKATASLTQQAEKINATEREVALTKAALAQRDKEVEELTERIRTLSHTLREQSSVTGRYVQRVDKMRADNDRLLDLCSSLQRGLVAQNQHQNDSPPTSPNAAGPAITAAASSNNNTNNNSNNQQRSRAKSTVFLDNGTSLDLVDVKQQLLEMRTARHAEKVANAEGNGPILSSLYNGRADLLYADDEDLREQCLTLEAEVKALSRKLQSSQSEVKVLQTRLEGMQKATDDETLTPRPNWLEVQRQVPGFTLNHLASSNDITTDLVTFMNDKVRGDLLENERRAIGRTVVQWFGESNICESDLLHTGKYFVPKGTGPHVPIYLRSRERVRDRKIRKGDVESFLKKFWEARKLMLRQYESGGGSTLRIAVTKADDDDNDSDAEERGGAGGSGAGDEGSRRDDDGALGGGLSSGARTREPSRASALSQHSSNTNGNSHAAPVFAASPHASLPPLLQMREVSAFIAESLAHSPFGALPPIDEFFLAWLVFETGGTRSAIELAYNIVAVCEKYQSDPDCGLFLKIIHNEVCEQTMMDQMAMVGELYEALRRLDSQRHGFVSRIAVHRTLARMFPAKRRQDMHRLRFALITFCRGAAVVDYKALFGEDHDGNQSSFIELLRGQHFDEIASHVVAVEEALRRIIDPETGRIAIEAARRVLLEVDPKLPEEHCDRIISCGCGLSNTELAAKGVLYKAPAEGFLKRIRTGVLLKRYSAMGDDEDEGGPHGLGVADEDDAAAESDEEEQRRLLMEVSIAAGADGGEGDAERRRLSAASNSFTVNTFANGGAGASVVEGRGSGGDARELLLSGGPAASMHSRGGGGGGVSPVRAFGSSSFPLTSAIGGDAEAGGGSAVLGVAGGGASRRPSMGLSPASSPNRKGPRRPRRRGSEYQEHVASVLKGHAEADEALARQLAEKAAVSKMASALGPQPLSAGDGESSSSSPPPPLTATAPAISQGGPQAPRPQSATVGPLGDIPPPPFVGGGDSVTPSAKAATHKPLRNKAKKR